MGQGKIFIYVLSFAFLFAVHSNAGPSIHYSHPATIDGAPNEVAFAMAQKEAMRVGVQVQNLNLAESKKSLLGTHFRYQQKLSGVDVGRSEYIVSVKNSGEVFKTFSTLVPEKKLNEIVGKGVSEDAAMKAAWDHIRVAGKLIEVPSVQKKWVERNGEYILVHQVRIATQSPMGYWEVDVSAVNGAVIEVRDRALPRKSAGQTVAGRLKGERKTKDMEAEIRKIQAKFQKKTLQKSKTLRGVGSGLVFDPDPMTTLNRDDLKDGTNAQVFKDAYFSVPLLDLTLKDGEFHLVGPWVRLSDFESPSVAPSTSSNGIWSGVRKDVTFNDVMTYYHVDKNQRYIQSLGFKGETGIQFNSIDVDANGVGGADNSHYIPGSNQMAFGHGCVDDNEDVDVILHEYGHAIHYSINSNWGGGDSGAMGEGFGDYWAGSYSYSTANGKDFQPNKIFTWDGQSDCWDGRRLDKTGARYDHSTNHYAHSRMDGFVSDELWSTPLFSTLKELMSQGVPRSEVDTIVLEAQFGLGGGLKMRDMAKSIIKVAKEMFPEGKHADVFLKHFKHHKILN